MVPSALTEELHNKNKKYGKIIKKRTLCRSQPCNQG